MMNRNILNPMMWTTGSWPSPVAPWIYWNTSSGLISLSSDWENWTTIADKNLWATEVYNYWDTLSQNNCWNYYQRWNNYGFPFSGGFRVRAWNVDASNYGPWNYYYGSYFFIPFNAYQPYWDSSHNKNLWGGVDNTVDAMKGPCPTWYHIPNRTEFETLWNILQWLWLPKNWTTTRDYLKIPRAWHISNITWQIIRVWEYCIVWTATASDTFDNSSWANDMRIVDEISRMAWANIRPFLNNSVTPDSTWTKLF